MCKTRARFNCRRQVSLNELKFNSVGGEGSSVGGAVGGPSFGNFRMVEEAEGRGKTPLADMQIWDLALGAKHIRQQLCKFGFWRWGQKANLHIRQRICKFGRR
jgi:hypothetical protein